MVADGYECIQGLLKRTRVVRMITFVFVVLVAEGVGYLDVL